MDLSRKMAALTPGFTRADIANVCDEAGKELLYNYTTYDLPNLTKRFFASQVWLLLVSFQPQLSTNSEKKNK